jgi:hypothetical protein
MPAFSQKEKLALLPQACIDKVPNSPADSIRSHFKDNFNVPFSLFLARCNAHFFENLRDANLPADTLRLSDYGSVKAPTKMSPRQEAVAAKEKSMQFGGLIRARTWT